ncbi:nuclear transport factor 2 family protein [Streptomyces coelicoflavus]|uniref:nuclear transport factor 2 family protein n=1 Tax=Streptomyces coelicoflavus TaxID=285562 RepID=UPI00369AA9A7
MPHTTPLARKAVAALVAVVSVVAVAGFSPASAATVAKASTGVLTVPDGQITSPATQNRNKRVAVRVLTQLYDRGNLKAADRHIRADCIQHSPLIADGRTGTKNFVRDSRESYPEQRYNIKRVMAQGDLVLVHANPVLVPGTRGVAVMDMFRFDARGQISEHWDTRQDVPATTVNGNDMFGTVSNPDTNQPSGPRRQTAFSEEVVTEYFNNLLVQKNPEAVRYLTPEFYQHNPASPSGSGGLREQFAEFFGLYPDVEADLKRVIADKDYVAIHFRYRLTPESADLSIMGIFRVVKRDGEYKIIEHWDVTQQVPAASANDNTMF